MVRKELIPFTKNMYFLIPGLPRLLRRIAMTPRLRHYFHGLVLVGAFQFPIICFGADFTASVDRPQLGVGEQLILQLKLTGASPKSSPDILGLKKDFTITGKQQFASTRIINGHVSTSISWQYGLIPRKEGTFTIPAIRIESSEGPLASQPVTLSVEKSSSSQKSHREESVTLTAKVNKNAPYKNEPIVYTVQLTSQEDLFNIQFKDLSVENAVVKASGKPKVYERTQNGLSVKVAEINYIITPLKDGSLKLPGLVVQGEKIVEDSTTVDRLLGTNGDPFRILQQLKNLNRLGMAQIEPFSIASNDIILEVKKPVQNLVPWLPAGSLKISETMKESQTLKVGEPFTRTFTIVAEGITGSQIPTLKDQQGEGNDFKVYGDKPVTEETLKNGKLTSWREESYTVIPQQAGTFTLPEISLSWWNVKENKVEYAKIPAHTLKVMPGQSSHESPPQMKESVENKALEKTANDLSRATDKEHVFFYSIIAVLVVILLFVLFWVIKLKNKLLNIKEKIQETQYGSSLESNEIKNRDLNIQEISKIKSADELQRFLQIYAFQNWDVPKNASLETIFEAAKKQCSVISQKNVIYIIKSLHDAIYDEKNINIEDVKKCCMDILQTTKKKTKNEKTKAKKLPDLNPT